jgi:RimJ/RimL family protein N-acetyltransferase/GNAT superfamily N-acetyltransferase
MRTTAGEYEIDDDPARIDAGAAVDFLTTQAYWARWRDGDDIRRQIRAAWRLIGAYDRSGAMVGFARAFGDGGSAYLADVYVLPGHRGAGLGQALVRMMIEDGPGAGLRWMLHTSDAHGLYRQFGFAAPNERYMERPGSDARPPRETLTLTGKHVRLEPLYPRHVPALVAASAGGGELYRWSPVPQDIDQARRFVQTALAAADSRTAVPFAVVRSEDDTVIGSTRFWNLDYWPWPDCVSTGTPDSCEIGHTWLSRDAVRTAANTEMKQLMLTHAFETWRVQSVYLHTDSRNERSRAAIQRLGARFEGILRAHRLGADGSPRDSARFSITAAEWPQVRGHLADLSARRRDG